MSEKKKSGEGNYSSRYLDYLRRHDEEKYGAYIPRMCSRCLEDLDRPGTTLCNYCAGKVHEARRQEWGAK